MELQVIHSTAKCNNSSCPTIYQNEEGSFVIQGFKLTSQQKSGIDIPEDEDAIEVPAEFIQEFLEKMK